MPTTYPNAQALRTATYDSAAQAVMRDGGAVSSWVAALPECRATVIDGTSAVTLGNGAAGDCRIFGIVILKNAGPATATITGISKLAPTGAAASASFVFTGSTADDRVIDMRGATNDIAALTVTASVDETVIVFWRPVAIQPPQVLTCTPARNALPAGLRDWNLSGSQKWTKTEVSGGTVTVSGDTITCATNGATGRAFMEFEMQPVTGANLNKIIVVTVELASSFTGPSSGGAVAFAGTNTLLGGSVAADFGSATYAAGTRIGFKSIFSAVTTTTLRIGLGANAAPGSSMTVSFKKPVVEVLDARSGGPYCEAIPYTSDAVFDFLPNVTFSGTNTGTVSMDRSTFLPAYGEVCLCVGDSFGNDAGLYSGLDGDWPDKLRKYRPDLAVTNWCVSGQTLATMATSIGTWLTNSAGSSNARGPKKAVIQGGINDIFASTSLANDPVPTMIANAHTIATAILNAGVKREEIVFVNVAPCSGAASYNAAYGHASKITSYNAALRAYCDREGFGYANIYDALRTSPTTLTLAARYDVGDSLHPNGDGFTVIAEMIDYAFRRGVKYLRNDL